MSEPETPSVLLVTMPWDFVTMPSLQLGILKAVLARAGIAARSLHANLTWVRDAALDPDDYAAIANRFGTSGLGDWIFALPLFGEADPERDAAYLQLLRDRGAPDRMLATATSLRSRAPAFVEATARAIVAQSPRVVGFTSTFNQNVPSLVVAKRIKELAPQTRIVFGGANCDDEMGITLHDSFGFVDVVVRGEAEGIIAPLFAELLAGEPITPRAGVCYRDLQGIAHVVPRAGAATVAMNDVPAPDFDDYFAQLEESPLRDALRPQVTLPFETARGCWWGAKAHCTFCGLNASAMAFRAKTPERTLDELLALAERHECLDFQCVDNIIAMDYVRTLLPRLAEANLDLGLFWETKANLKKEQLVLFRDAGVRAIQPGIESLSTPILKLVRKGVTALQNIRLLKWCAELGIQPQWNLLYGLPQEPPAEYAAMADLARSLVHLPPPNLNRLHLDRFSPYHGAPEEHGLRIVGAAAHYAFVYPLEGPALRRIAYAFELAYEDGRDPEAYVGALRDVVTTWRAGRDSLVLRRGPGFVQIADRRSTVGHGNYTLRAEEAAIYEACDAGATLAEIHERLRQAEEGADRATIADFLTELVAARLVYEEGGRYLSLAVATGGASA